MSVGTIHFSLKVERYEFINKKMADLEIGGPPGLLPVALVQLPYAADPGTLTEWLLRDTAREPVGAVLKVMKAVTAQYADLSPLDADNYKDMVEVMAASIFLGSDELNLFLTVTILAGSHQVFVISGLSRYSRHWFSRRINI